MSAPVCKDCHRETCRRLIDGVTDATTHHYEMADCLRAQLSSANKRLADIAEKREAFVRARKAMQVGFLAGAVVVNRETNDLTGALVDAQSEALAALLDAARRK